MARIFPTRAHIAVYLSARDGEFPLDLSPVAWWDGTDASTMNTAANGSGSVPSSSGNVARWVDKVGSVPLIRSSGTTPTWNGSDGVVFAEGVVDNLTDATTKFNFLHSGAGGSAFLKVHTDNTAGQHVIFMTNGRGSSNIGMTLEASGGQMRALVSDGGGWLTTAEIGTITEGVQDIVYSLDGTTVSIWINGTEFTTSLSGAGSSSNHAGDLTVGDDGSRDVDGPIKQIVFVNRAATADEVAQWSDWTP